MPFSPANRRLTILSIVTLALLTVVVILLFASDDPKKDRLLNTTAMILGLAALWWKSEWEGRRTRHDVRGPMNQVALSANEAAKKAEDAVIVTQETFDKLQLDLQRIDARLNGDLDNRIVSTVATVIRDQLPAALDQALEEKLEPAIEHICRRIINSPKP